MSLLYETIDPVNYLDIYKAYLLIKDSLRWNEGVNGSKQCSLQSAADGDLGTGRAKQGRDEHEYILINPEFKNTVFEDLINKYKLFRSRLMWVGRKSCYSIHTDRSRRIHIPLLTNPQCMFLFPENVEMFHLPAGHSYLVDTTRPHTFCNFSDSNRLHLVGCVD